MGKTIYGINETYGMCYALWRKFGREIRIKVQMSDGTVFNEDNVTFLEITDDGNIFETYMKKVVLKIQATAETEEMLKSYVENADSVKIEYGVYCADEVKTKTWNGEKEYTIPAGTTNMIRVPTMYVSHEETDTDYDEVTKIATFTCYDAMKILSEIPMSSVTFGPGLGYLGSSIAEKIKEVINVQATLEEALSKKYTVGEYKGTTIGYMEMTAAKNFYIGKSIRDYLNHLSNVLYCAFYVNINQQTGEEYLTTKRIEQIGGVFCSDITIDDIRNISLGKVKNTITGLAYISALKTELQIEGNGEGNVVYKFASPDAMKADLFSSIESRHSAERKEMFDELKDMQLRDFDVMTYGMPWIQPLYLVQYTNMKGAVSKLLVNSSVLTISNGITQRFYNRSVDTLFENKNETSEDIENLNAANVTISKSMAPVENNSCDLGTSDKRFNTIYCVDTNTTSDLKNKENIQSLVDNDKLIEFFKAMKPCSFTMKNGDTGRKHMGFIAQWCAKAAKETMGDLSFFAASYVNEKGECEYFRDDVDDSELSWGLKLNQLIAPLWAVVQIQLDKIENLEKQIEELKNGN